MFVLANIYMQLTKYVSNQSSAGKRQQVLIGMHVVLFSRWLSAVKKKMKYKDVNNRRNKLSNTHSFSTQVTKLEIWTKGSQLIRLTALRICYLIYRPHLPGYVDRRTHPLVSKVTGEYFIACSSETYITVSYFFHLATNATTFLITSWHFSTSSCDAISIFFLGRG